MTVSAIVWSNPENLERPPAAWMTVRFVARSWEVPPEAVAEAAGVPAGGTWRRTTLEEIAAGQGHKLIMVDGVGVACPNDCTDGVLNGDESDIDCGGSWPSG